MTDPPLPYDTHNVGLLHDDEILAVDLDLGTGPLSKQHAVADFDIERMQLAIVAAGAGAGGDNFAFHRLFLGGIGNEDAALRPLPLLDPADQHTILQWSKIHGTPP